MVWPMSLPSEKPIVSCLIKMQNGFNFWYWLTQVVLEKRPLDKCLFLREPGLDGPRFLSIRVLEESFWK